MATLSSTRKLRKSSTDRLIDGICGGVAEYFHVDSTLVRIGWVLLAFAGGVGLVLYLAAILIMPSPDSTILAAPPVNRSRVSGFLVAGILAIVVGCLWLFKLFGIFSLPFLAWYSWKAILPLVLIAIGVILLVRRPTPAGIVSDPGTGSQDGPSKPRRFYRSRREKKLFGVCGGLGEYFGVDPVIVRLAFLAILILSFGIGLVAYLLLSILFPEEPITFAA